MKKKNIYILSLAVLVFAGCNDFLDKNPDDRTDINDVEKVQALLVNAYPQRTFAGMIETRCDGMIDYGSTLDGSQMNSYFNVTIGSFYWDPYSITETGSETYEMYWSAAYASIAASNHALVAIDNLGGDELNVHRAEARLTRALNHFNLLSLYSNMFQKDKQHTNMGIPFVDEPEEVVHKIYDRKTVAYTLERIKEDITFGIKNVGGRDMYKYPDLHFDLNSANALAARVALFTEDYQGTIAHANTILPSVTTTQNVGTNADGSDRLIPAADDPAYKYLSSKLHNWESHAALPGSNSVGLAFSSPTHSSNLLTCEVITVCRRLSLGKGYSRYGLSSSAVSEITSANLTGARWEYPPYGLTGDNISFIPKFYEDFKISTVSDGTSSGVSHSKIVQFRLEEMLLARAEAYAMTGEYDKAIWDLNMYITNRIDGYSRTTHAIHRDKILEYYKDKLESEQYFINNAFNSYKFAGLEGDEKLLCQGLILTILDFRRAEFVHEGMRYFDILRWNIPVVHFDVNNDSSTLTPDDDRRVLQIPQTAILSGIPNNPMINIPNPWSNRTQK